MKSLLPEGGLGFHNATPYLLSEARTKALKSFFTGKQCCFITSVITIARLFGCYKNPYLSLFNLYCGFRLSRPSLAAIDLAERHAAPRGWEPRRRAQLHSWL